MTISDTQFQAWLEDQAAIRCVLVEVEVGQASGGTQTRYLSNTTYVTGGGDSPSHTAYLARITGGLNITKSLSLSGATSLSYGDIELVNTDGALDSWVDDYWVNRPVAFYLGSPNWSRADFRLVFSGRTTGIDMRSRTRLNIKLSDVLQRLNTPASEAKIGGTKVNADTLLPLCFGECHNVTPVLVDPTTNEFQVHQGAIEGVIEVRDNGVPVAFTQTPSNGKFKLSANPSGTITCSVQGAKVPYPARLNTDVTFQTTAWVKQKLNALTVASEAPFAGSTAYNLVPNATSGQHYIETTATVSAGADTFCALYVKIDQASGIEMTCTGVETGSNIVVALSQSGVCTTSLTGGAATNGGYATAAGGVKLDNGYYVLYISGRPDSSSTTRRLRLRVSQAGSFSFTGDGTSTYVRIASPVFVLGSTPVLPAAGSLTASGDLYVNSAMEIVKCLATMYGNTSQRLSTSDFDYSTLAAVGLATPQPVGVYLQSRENVLDICSKLLASTGSSLFVTTEGKVGVVRLGGASASLPTPVGVGDILEASLEVASLAPVVAAVKLGFCKNWTVQDGLTTGIVPEHVALYAEEWMTTTVSDSATAANYNLFTDPEMVESLLVTTQDAAVEADRRLKMFNRQRKSFRYSAFYSMVFEQLGSYQTLTHPRFGLAAGATAQVTSVSINFLNNKVNFEVLV